MNEWIKGLARGTSGRIALLVAPDLDEARAHVLDASRRVNANLAAIGLIDNTGTMQIRSGRLLSFVQRIERQPTEQTIVWVQGPGHLFVKALGGYESGVEAGIWAVRSIIDAALPKRYDVVIAGSTAAEIDQAASALRPYDRSDRVQLAVNAVPA